MHFISILNKIIFCIQLSISYIIFIVLKINLNVVKWFWIWISQDVTCAVFLYRTYFSCYHLYDDNLTIDSSLSEFNIEDWLRSQIRGNLRLDSIVIKKWMDNWYCILLFRPSHFPVRVMSIRIRNSCGWYVLMYTKRKPYHVHDRQIIYS